MTNENKHDPSSKFFTALGSNDAAQTEHCYWRSLDEQANTSAYRELFDRYAANSGADFHGDVNRREFLRLMGASLALAGLSACTRAPNETIVPYVRQPEEIVPGRPLFFATAMTVNGLATGLLVESHMGRPTKVEGNPSHPASLGATDAIAQASVLGLYDPDRSQVLTYLGRVRPWNDFLSAMQQLRGTAKGLRILTGAVGSPTLAWQLNDVLARLPGSKWHQWEPSGRHHAPMGAQLAFGENLDVQYRFDRAAIVLAFDADMIGGNFGMTRYAVDFARRRRPASEGMNRFYAVESTPSAAGAAADHRLALAPSEAERFALALAARLGVKVGRKAQLPEAQERWLSALAADLDQHRGSSLVLAGEQQAPAVHALAHAINQHLGNFGHTVAFTQPVEAQPASGAASLGQLTDEMAAGLVDTLIVVDANPVYTAPSDFAFAEKMSRVRLRIHFGLYQDETAQLCHWHVPATHYLESWSDARAYDGTATIVQPLIAPLYSGKTAHELLAALSDRPQESSYDIVQRYWRGQMGKSGDDFDSAWRQSLHDGVIRGSAFPVRTVSLKAGWEKILDAPGGANRGTQAGAELTLLFRPDPFICDGQLANNGWLQELPKPLTKLTWENAAIVSPSTAARLGLEYVLGFGGGAVETDVVELSLGDRSVRAPVWILPGQPDDTVTVHLGYGRERAGKIGTGIGFNAYVLRQSESLWFASGLKLRKVGERHPLAVTQTHHNMQGRELVRASTLQEYAKGADRPAKPHQGGRSVSLYPEHPYQGHAWGMAIDLSVCIGCNACVAACQAENNIPVVGKNEVLRSREMHWLRVDSYFKGAVESPQTFYQPVPCMHCEKAPCEVVCPVTATAHSAEGLNDMVYNRCVGTRYCSNNCPYKVRRFNFLQYSDWRTGSLRALRNPDVTVRSRGVMEKCTYCVQRINHARIEAETENRNIRDGDIVTACQQACPTQAIVFGDLRDPNSRVSRMKADGRNYSLLEELGTEPRTSYLTAVRNPHPEIARAEKTTEGDRKDKPHA
jgi:molybdopterin-containing oxidoreductase family iron-sulfur binding subunit